jgi:hypothetical protein
MEFGWASALLLTGCGPADGGPVSPSAAAPAPSLPPASYGTSEAGGEAESAAHEAERQRRETAPHGEVDRVLCTAWAFVLAPFTFASAPTSGLATRPEPGPAATASHPSQSVPHRATVPS